MSRCIESLQRQTCQDFEVIFVDDYSTDDTCLFLQNFLSSTYKCNFLGADNKQ